MKALGTSKTFLSRFWLYIRGERVKPFIVASFYVQKQRHRNKYPRD